MATKATSKKVIVISAPKIVSAFHAICDLTAKNDMNAEIAILKLANEMKKSKLSINDIRKVIKETNRESSVLKISQIEGLPTFADMNEKYEEFRALPLAKKLTKAAATYKLGVGKVEKLEKFSQVESAIKDFNQAKNHKAKSQPAKAAKKANTESTLKAFLAFINALNADALTDSEMDVLSDISIALIELEPVTA